MAINQGETELPHIFVPIYKKEPRTGLIEHIGTGFLVATHSGHWLFTAAHVLAEHKVANITLPGTPFFDLAGEVFSSSALDLESTHRDPIDLAFTELAAHEITSLEKLGLEFHPLSLDSVEGTQHDLSTATFYAGGFPLTRVEIDGTNMVSDAKRYIYSNRLFSEEKMRKFGHDSSYRMGLRYERLKQSDGSSSKPLDPRGMSGGPIWVDFAGQRRLAGLITDYDATKSLLLGTRLHLLLIALRDYIRSRILPSNEGITGIH